MSLLEEVHRNRIRACLQALYAVKYVKEDNVPCQIEEGLFLGSVGVALNKQVLKSFNITHILIVAKSLDPAFPNDFIHKKIEVLDTPDTNLQEYFDECFGFIDEARRAGGGVLVHCFAGRSRSDSGCKICMSQCARNAENRSGLMDALPLYEYVADIRVTFISRGIPNPNHLLEEDAVWKP